MGGKRTEVDSSSFVDGLDDDLHSEVDNEELVLNDNCELESTKSANGKAGKN